MEPNANSNTVGICNWRNKTFQIRLGAQGLINFSHAQPDSQWGLDHIKAMQTYHPNFDWVSPGGYCLLLRYSGQVVA